MPAIFAWLADSRSLKVVGNDSDYTRWSGMTVTIRGGRECAH